MLNVKIRPPSSRPTFLSPRTATLVSLLALLWAGLTAFYCQQNGFPFYYHTDEPSKVAQLLEGPRNFFHPQLLLITAETLWRAKGAEPDPQRVVVAGRTASAAYAAGAVCLLAALAWRLGGLAASVGTALLAGTHPLLFELAHYMKEDCAWLFGLAAFFLAADGVARRPESRARAFWVGAAAGIATSSKYFGITTLAAGLVFVWLVGQGAGLRGSERARALLAPLLGGFFLSFAVVNWLVLLHPLQAVDGLRGELGRMSDVAADAPEAVQWKFLRKYLKHAWPALAPLTTWFAVCFALREGRRWTQRRAGFSSSSAARRECRGATEWLLLLFPAALMAVLLVTPRVKDRYLLPIVGAHAVLAALGAVEIGALLRRTAIGARSWIATTVALLVAGAFAATNFPTLARCWRELGGDARGELVAYLRAHVPAGEIVAHDPGVALGRAREAGLRADYFLPQPTVTAPHYLPELGTLQDFQRWGVRWFAVTEEDYGGILSMPASPRRAAMKARCEAFYGNLFARGKLVWERPRGRLTYLHPALRLYRWEPEE